METKAVALDAAAPAPPGADAAELLDAVVLPTGVPLGGDLIVSGALGRAVVARLPKATLADDWQRPVGVVRSALELPAGDPRLPATLPDGSPWPAAAGGLLCRVAYIEGTADGRLAIDSVRRRGSRQHYSVGYRVLDAEHKAGVRHIRAIDVYTISPRPERPEAFRRKAAPAPGLEVKDGAGTAVARPRHRSGQPTVVTRCSACDRPTAAVVPGLCSGEELICAACVRAAGDVTAEPGAVAAESGTAVLRPDDLIESYELREDIDRMSGTTAEREYAEALDAEIGYELERDGRPVLAADDPPGTGRAWTRRPPLSGWGRP